MQPMQPLQPGCIEKEKIRHRRVMETLIRAGLVFVWCTLNSRNSLYINDFGIKRRTATLYQYSCSTVVRETGLEPVRYEHTPLKRARLPIPPLSLGTTRIVADKNPNVKPFLANFL